MLNFIVLLTLLLVETSAVAQENKEIENFQQSILKQSHPNVRVTNIQHFSASNKSNKILTKDDIVAPSFIIDEDDLCSTQNLRKTTSYSQQNNPYSNANSTSNYLNNKDRIKLERLDKVNTLKKSLGKTHQCRDNFPIYKDPNDKSFLKVDPANHSFTIDPANLLRLLETEKQ